MPTTKTIKPGGGGDFTTLQAWEDWADGEASAAQWAECYTGGNLGAVVFSGWASTPDAGNRPKIYTPAAQRHVGSDGGATASVAGTVVSISVNYVWLDGVTLKYTSASNGTAIGVMASNVTVENCLVLITGTGSASAVSCAPSSGTSYAGLLIQNNIFVDQISGSAGTYAAIDMTSLCFGGTTAVTAVIYNNTIYSTAAKWKYGITAYRQQVAAGTANLTLTVKNNIAMGVLTGCYVTTLNSGTGTLSITASYNLSSDATGDDWGATGAQISKTASSQFVNVASDWNLKLAADAIDTGTDLSASGVTTDYSGTTRSGTYDIGADEYVTPAAPAYIDHCNRCNIQLPIWI